MSIMVKNLDILLIEMCDAEDFINIFFINKYYSNLIQSKIMWCDASAHSLKNKLFIENAVEKPALSIVSTHVSNSRWKMQITL